MKRLLLSLLVLITLQTQAQISPCDSVSYTIVSALGGTLQLNGTITTGFSGSITSWDWTVCDESFCFSDTGPAGVFTQFTINDTLKVCLSTNINYMGTTYSCIQCDSLVYDAVNGWVLLNMGNPSFVSELEITSVLDNKIYDLLGRELIEIPIGVMYFKNRRCYLKTKR